MKKYFILFLIFFNVISCNKKEKNEKVAEKFQNLQSIQSKNKSPYKRHDNINDEKQEKILEIREMENEKIKESKNNKIVYLTFDDGPTKTTTLEILKILKANNIKATFFVIGQNPEIYKKIADDGHKLELHTYTHIYKQIYASEESYFSDLYKIRDLIKKTTGIDSKIVRMPGGSSTTKASKTLKKQIIKRLKKEGFIYQDWNCDSKDAAGIVMSTEEEAKNSFCNLKKVNLLMHDTKKMTVKSLQKIIDKYRENGYSFEVLTENSPKFQHMKEPKD